MLATDKDSTMVHYAKITKNVKMLQLFHSSY